MRAKIVAAVVMIMVAGVATRGGTIEEAEAAKRGVSVETIKLEDANARIASLNKQIETLRTELEAAKAATADANARTQTYASALAKLKHASDPPKIVAVGDIIVSITGASVAKVPVVQIMGGDTETSTVYLVVKIHITNKSASKVFVYETLRGKSISYDRDYATAEDDIGNSYRRIDFGMSKVAGSVERSVSIYPGKEVDDVLVFDKPVTPAKTITIDFPLSPLGGEGNQKLTINCPREQ